MKRTLFTLSILVATTFASQAQTNLDSLWNIWNDNTQADTTRLKAIDDIAWNGYLFRQPDSAFYFAQMQYDLAEKSGLKKEMAGALNIQGISLNIRGDYPKALDYFQRGLELYKEMGNKSGIAGALGNIGTVYQNQGNIIKALDYFQRGLKIKEETGDKKGISKSLNNIGLIYMDQGDYPKALDYHQRSLKIKEEFGDKKGIAIALNNIGTILREQGDYPKALDYFHRCLKIEEEMGEKFGIAGSLNNIGLIYMDQGDYLKALDYHQRSLKIKEEFSDQQGIAASLNNIGFLYHKQGDYQKAINQCSKGLKLAQEIGDVELQSKACECLYDGYKAIGNGNKALFYHEQLSVLKDSLFNEENTKKLTRLELNYEFDKKETAARLEQEKKDAIAKAELKRNKFIRNGFMGAFAVMLLFATIFFNQRNKIKKGKKQSDDLLLNILPAEVAEELKAYGKTEAKHFDEATILFTDFKGFTEQSARLSAKDLVLELNICFKAFDGIMDKFKIEKIKTIGDAYMAASGINTDGINERESAKLMVLAALKMQEFICTRKAAMNEAGKPAFEMRVGIHTGPVVAGIVGVKKFQYDIWGDTVNTAARLESSGEVDKVNVSHATYELLKDDEEFTFESRGKIAAKGKGEIEMYFVSKA